MRRIAALLPMVWCVAGCGADEPATAPETMPNGDASVEADVAEAAVPMESGPDSKAEPVSVTEKGIAELQSDMEQGRLTSAGIVDAYVDRIMALDRNGPTLRSVLAVNPKAREDAAALDAERASSGARGPLHGIPLLIKDNIETADGLPTTAGSLALAQNVGHRDNPAVAKLRAAGAVILGKTNLSEWANGRGYHSVSGWSATGGLTLNAYAQDRSACGSSSGSGVAVSASFAAAALGTETDGSVICPSTVNGIVGLKPTVGLVSRAFVVPLSHTQDTAGPMGRSVQDVATLLTVMAGSDPLDVATAQADQHKQDYVAALSADALAGKRLGVLRVYTGHDAEVDAVFEDALAKLQGAGATLVDITWAPAWSKLGQDETRIMTTELKADLNAYLASTPTNVSTRTLADLIAFNTAHAGDEMQYFQQEFFEAAEATAGLEDPTYQAALSSARSAAATNGIDMLLAKHGVQALIAPTGSPAWTVNLTSGDPTNIIMASSIPAIAGYPHLTVPMGQVKGLPVGMSFMGAAWSEASLLGMGHAFESIMKARKPPALPAFDAGP